MERYKRSHAKWNCRWNMRRTEMARKAVGRQARPERSGGSAPEILRPPPPPTDQEPKGWGSVGEGLRTKPRTSVLTRERDPRPNWPQCMIT